MMMFMTEGEKDDILTNPLIDNTENSDDDSDDDDQELKKDVRKQAQRAVTNPAMLSSDQARALMIDSLKKRSSMMRVETSRNSLLKDGSRSPVARRS